MIIQHGRVLHSSVTIVIVYCLEYVAYALVFSHIYWLYRVCMLTSIYLQNIRVANFGDVCSIFFTVPVL